MRSALLQTTQKLSKAGLLVGSAGNVSVRHGNGVLITPSGVPVEALTESAMVELSVTGEVLSVGKPSSEWRFHCDIYQARPEIQAVIHTHSMFATTMACLRKDIPPFHYMISVAGGDSIRCASYALFGTQELSDVAVTALQGRRACLLANHGMIAVGTSLEQAFEIAQEVENLCEQYWRALQVGAPHILTTEEMQAVFEQFKGYGGWAR